MSDYIELRNKKTGEIVRLRKKEKDPFLPGQEKTERKIASRKDALTGVGETIKETKEGFFDVPNTFGEAYDKFIQPQKTMGKVALGTIGGIFQRGLAAFANAGIELQKGKIKSVPEQALKGIKGEKLGQLGDIIRTTNVGGPANELLSSVIGLGAAAGLTNLATSGRIVGGAKKVEKALKAAREAGKSKKLYFYKQQAEKLASGIDEVLTGVKYEYDDLYRLQGLGNKAIENQDDLMKVQEIATRLKSSPTILNKIKKTFGIKGSPNTIDTLKTIKTEIGKGIPRKVWSGLDEATEVQAQLMDDYHTLNDIIANNAGVYKDRLLILNNKARQVYRGNRIVKGITKKKVGGEVLTSTKIKNIRGQGMQDELSELFKLQDNFGVPVRSLVQEIASFQRWEKLKKIAGIGIPTAVGVGLVTQQVKKGLREAGGGTVDTGGGDY